MLAAFHNLSLIEHTDFIRILDCGKTVRNGDSSAGFHQPLQSLLHQAFRLRIECGGGLIQNQYGRILENGAGNADALTLPAGKFAALILAQAGQRPIVLERGEDAISRHKKVAAFWKNGTLDAKSNVQSARGARGPFRMAS